MNYTDAGYVKVESAWKDGARFQISCIENGARLFQTTMRNELGTTHGYYVEFLSEGKWRKKDITKKVWDVLKAEQWGKAVDIFKTLNEEGKLN